MAPPNCAGPPDAVNGRGLIRLRPRPDRVYLSNGRTVLATEADGFIGGKANRGLYVYETRLISRYRYGIAGAPLYPVLSSNCHAVLLARLLYRAEAFGRSSGHRHCPRQRHRTASDRVSSFPHSGRTHARKCRSDQFYAVAGSTDTLARAGERLHRSRICSRRIRKQMVASGRVEAGPDHAEIVWCVCCNRSTPTHTA